MRSIPPPVKTSRIPVPVTISDKSPPADEETPPAVTENENDDDEDSSTVPVTTSNRIAAWKVASTPQPKVVERGPVKKMRPLPSTTPMKTAGNTSTIPTTNVSQSVKKIVPSTSSIPPRTTGNTSNIPTTNVNRFPVQTKKVQNGPPVIKTTSLPTSMTERKVVPKMATSGGGAPFQSPIRSKIATLRTLSPQVSARKESFSSPPAKVSSLRSPTRTKPTGFKPSTPKILSPRIARMVLSNGKPSSQFPDETETTTATSDIPTTDVNSSSSNGTDAPTNPASKIVAARPGNGSKAPTDPASKVSPPMPGYSNKTPTDPATKIASPMPGNGNKAPNDPATKIASPNGVRMVTSPTVANVSPGKSLPKELPLQLRQQKKNWDVSAVPRGNVMDRIKNFSSDPNQKNAAVDEELTNTGKTNESLRKRRIVEREQQLQRARELEERQRERQRMKKFRFGKSFTGKKNAATAIQSIVRMYKAKKIALIKVEEAIARKEKERLDQAATKIQAIIRSILTRVQVSKLVDAMIADLMEQNPELRPPEPEVTEDDKDEDQEATPPTASEEPGDAGDAEMEEVRDCHNEESDEVAVGDPHEESPTDRDPEEVPKTEEEVPKTEDEVTNVDNDQEDGEGKESAAEERRRQIEEEIALGRASREATEEELAREKAEAEAEAEAIRLAKEEEERANKEAIAAERERRLRDMNLFVGPLPWGVGLLPDWWMDEVPHHDLDLEVITEEDNGEDFEDWRNLNLMIPA